MAHITVGIDGKTYHFKGKETGMVTQEKVPEEIDKIDQLFKAYARKPYGSMEFARLAYHIARQDIESYQANLQAQSADWRG